MANDPIPGIQKVKVSELDEVTSFEGLHALGVSNDNESVKIPLEPIANDIGDLKAKSNSLPEAIQIPLEADKITKTSTDIQLNYKVAELIDGEYVESDANAVIPSANPTYAGAYPADHYIKLQDLPNDAQLQDALEGKQNTLTAGTNITIENDVISASGGGGDIVVEQTVTESTTAVPSGKAVKNELYNDLRDGIHIRTTPLGVARSEAVAIGNSANANSSYTVAIGSSARAVGSGSVALGSESVVHGGDLFPNDTLGIVSVGVGSLMRRITGVRDGVYLEDAATVGQLNQVVYRETALNGSLSGQELAPDLPLLPAGTYRYTFELNFAQDSTPSIDAQTVAIFDSLIADIRNVELYSGDGITPTTYVTATVTLRSAEQPLFLFLSSNNNLTLTTSRPIRVWIERVNLVESFTTNSLELFTQADKLQSRVDELDTEIASLRKASMLKTAKPEEVEKAIATMESKTKLKEMLTKRKPELFAYAEEVKAQELAAEEVKAKLLAEHKERQAQQRADRLARIAEIESVIDAVEGDERTALEDELNSLKWIDKQQKSE